MPVDKILVEIGEEVDSAAKKWGEFFASAHEGWAVIKEELDELWEEVLKKRSERGSFKMRRECIQIAAMAVKFIRSMEVQGSKTIDLPIVDEYCDGQHCHPGCVHNKSQS